ncbi:tRNA (adenosine(37)-N6)-threonylcarbamoyltransferase complex dimerization subunit type 1 TsaB [Agaribacter flavus]|uniref:tRNA threonylcarbamoyladenosine biosynthesis protein TsaB n=1 Tax=Agaribacter flavus TaxID=1902781 RepID=A0ABV7FNR4_9ALTE
MNVLAIDTSTEACSVAICTRDLIDGEFEICPQQHSQKLLEMIDRVLSKHMLSLTDMELLAYGCGPGSFTGVRIAASTIQGLSFGADLPVAQISTLATMAQENYERFRVESSMALIDARMQEVYKGMYSVDPSSQVVKLVGVEAVLPPNELSDELKKIRDSSYVGSGYHAYREALQIETLPKQLNVSYPNAKYMLSLAKHIAKQNGTVSAANIAPTYIRDKVTWKKLPGK